MKHKRSLISIAMATLVLVSLVAVASVSVNAGDGGSTKVKPSGALVGGAGPVYSAPAICSPGGAQLALFVLGGGGALVYKHWDGYAWSGWTSLGGYVTADPAVVSRGAGVIDVFVRGGDGALWTRSTSNGGGSWSKWFSLGGGLLDGTGPTAYAWPSGRIGWFVTGRDHALWHMWWDQTGYHGWENLGGYLTSSPAATSPGSGMITVDVRGGNGALWQCHWTTSEGWSTWVSFGGQISPGTGPAACTEGTRLNVFVKGMNGALWHKTWPLNSWENLGGTLTSSPAATSPSTGMIDVYVRGDDGYIWGMTYYNGWTTWYNLGGIYI